MSSTPPRTTRVLETALYFSDQDRAEKFYSDVLGFRLLDREPGRSLFYRAGDSVLLLFNADATRDATTLPAHGARGAIHVCFQVPAEDYEAWKSHLEARGIEILQQVEWKPGLSLFFHDPDGNLLELASADIWPP